MQVPKTEIMKLANNPNNPSLAFFYILPGKPLLAGLRREITTFYYKL